MACLVFVLFMVNSSPFVDDLNLEDIGAIGIFIITVIGMILFFLYKLINKNDD